MPVPAGSETGRSPGGETLAPVVTGLAAVEEALAQRQHPCRIEGAFDDPARRVQAGFAVLGAVYTAKLRAIAAALRRSLEEREFIIYASAGRLLLEHFAMLVYYGREKIQPLLGEEGPDGLSAEKAPELGLVLDCFLSGNRHDWSAMLRESFPVHLVEGRVRQQQVNILTCVARWNRVEPGAEELYHLFCDMVHPNVGSLLLLLHRDGDGLLVADRERASIAEEVVGGTAPRLLVLLERTPSILDRIRAVATGGEGTPPARAGEAPSNPAS